MKMPAQAVKSGDAGDQRFARSGYSPFPFEVMGLYELAKPVPPEGRQGCALREFGLHLSRRLALRLESTHALLKAD